MDVHMSYFTCFKDVLMCSFYFIVPNFTLDKEHNLLASLFYKSTPGCLLKFKFLHVPPLFAMLSLGILLGIYTKLTSLGFLLELYKIVDLV